MGPAEILLNVIEKGKVSLSGKFTVIEKDRVRERTFLRNGRKARKIMTEEIKQVVKSRYSKFAETGGHKEPC